jgi:hypothetical protein
MGGGEDGAGVGLGFVGVNRPAGGGEMGRRWGRGEMGLRVFAVRLERGARQRFLCHAPLVKRTAKPFLCRAPAHDKEFFYDFIKFIKFIK